MTTTLSNERIIQLCPAIGSEIAHESRSGRYGFIRTLSIVDALRDHGWFPTEVQAGKPRSEKGMNYGKHVLRFRREQDLIQEAVVGDTVPEAVLFNAHDGTAAYRFMFGLFRFVCANGMVISDATFSAIRVRHTKNIVKEAIEASYEILDRVPVIMGRVETLRSLELTSNDQRVFAERAGELRTMQTSPNTLLRARRAADRGDDLWKVYNRVQENLLKGNVRAVDAAGRIRHTKPLTNPSKVLDVNRQLWDLVDETAELKLAA